jgi:DNA-binding MarR family transcriptional regulator
MDRQLAQEVRSRCVALHVRRAARQVCRVYNETLKPVGLTNGQFSLMALLAGLGPTPLNILAEELGSDRTTLNATLKPLERDKLVQSATDPEDARIRLLSLTRKGMTRLDEASSLWRAAQAKIEKKLGAIESDSLRTHLQALY